MGKNIVCWKFEPFGILIGTASVVHTVRHRADAQVVTDRDTGRSKGFGFVEMDTDAQARAAIQGLNDYEHEGRWLVVSEAKQPRVAHAGGFAGGPIDGSARTGGGGGYGGDGRSRD